MRKTTFPAVVFGLTALLAARSVPAFAGAADGEVVTFGPSAWTKGDTIEAKTHTDSSLEMTLSVNGEVVEHVHMKSLDESEKVTHILATDDEGPTKVSMRYDKIVSEQHTANEGETEEASPAEEHENSLAGRTFLIEKTSQVARVTNEDGSEVESKIAAVVRAKEVSKDGSLERGVDHLADFVAGKKLAVGASLHVPKEIAAALAGEEDPKSCEMELKLVETRAKDGVLCGVFHTQVRFESATDEDGSKAAWTLVGETLISVKTARFVSSDLEGTAKVAGQMHGDDQSVDMNGDGTIKVVESSTYKRD